MKKRVCAIMLIAVMAVGSLAGCSSKKDDNGESGADTSKVTEKDDTTNISTDDISAGGDIELVGLSLPLLDGEFLNALVNDIKSSCEAEGWNCEVASAEGSVSTQVEQIENFVNMGVDAIIVIPIDPVGTTDVLKSAREAGIRIIIYGATMDDLDAYDVILGSDKKEQASECLEGVNDWIEANYPDAEDNSIEAALIINTASGDLKEMADALGNVEALCPKVKLVETYDMVGETSTSAKTQEYVSLMRITHPDVKILICSSDTYGLAADELLMNDSEIDKTTFAIFCGDSSGVSIKRVAESTEGTSLLRCVIQYGINLGENFADAIAGNIELDENKINWSPFYLVTPDNAKDYLE